MKAMIGIDTYIAVGLIGIIIVVFLIYKIGILPKKSLPFIIGGLLAVFGLHLFRETRSNQQREKLKKLEDDLKEKEKELQKMKGVTDRTDKELQEVISKEEKIREAHQKAILITRARSKKEKEELITKSDLEIFEMFDKEFGN